MERYIALDVHAESTTCVVMGPTGKRLKCDVIETTATELIEFVKKVPGQKHLVLEEGTQSSWLYEVLRPFVEDLVVAIPQASSGNKSDERDAWGLAEALRTKALKQTVYKRPKELSDLRAAVRVYQLVTSDIVRLKNRLRVVFRARGIQATTEVYEPGLRKNWLKLLPADSRYKAEMLGLELDALAPLRERAEEQLLAEGAKVPAVAQLASIPGLGPIRAATIVAITISPARFRTTRQYWSFAGLGIVTRSSADWIKDESGKWTRGQVPQLRGLNRNRHPLLKSAFKSAALTVTTLSTGPLKESYERLLAGGTKPNLARLTIARRLASVVLALWKKQEVYDSKKHVSHIATA